MTFDPRWTSAPGKTLVRHLSAQGMPLSQAAEYLFPTDREFDRFLNGFIEIDDDLALKLEELSGKPQSFWLKRDKQYRLTLEAQSESVLESGLSPVEWVRRLPINQMVKQGWIEKYSSRKDTAGEALKFFGVSSVAEWQEQFEGEISAAAFRASESFDRDDAVTAVWLRKAELLAERTNCAGWNKQSLLKKIPKLRQLSVSKNPKLFFPQLITECASVGISLVFVPSLKGCPAYGASRFLSPTKAMIVLSNRYKTDDHFWFTFFHEIGHLVLHDKKALFIESNETISTHEENEANTFSEETLMPPGALEELKENRITAKAVTRLAVRLKIARGIVVGQLQYKGIIPQNSLNYLKRRFSNEDFSNLTSL